MDSPKLKGKVAFGAHLVFGQIVEWVAIPAKAGNESLAGVGAQVGHAVLDEFAGNPSIEVLGEHHHSAGSAAFDASSLYGGLAGIAGMAAKVEMAGCIDAVHC